MAVVITFIYNPNASRNAMQERLPNIDWRVSFRLLLDPTFFNAFTDKIFFLSTLSRVC